MGYIPLDPRSWSRVEKAQMHCWTYVARHPQLGTGSGFDLENMEGVEMASKLQYVQLSFNSGTGVTRFASQCTRRV